MQAVRFWWKQKSCLVSTCALQFHRKKLLPVPWSLHTEAQTLGWEGLNLSQVPGGRRTMSRILYIPYHIMYKETNYYGSCKSKQSWRKNTFILTYFHSSSHLEQFFKYSLVSVLVQFSNLC